MRKIKQSITYTVPSWNFCNKDEFQQNGRYSKELCRFCIKSKDGHRCLLYDKALAADPNFVHKTADCINASAGFKTEVTESIPPVVVPKLIVRETIKSYKKTVKELMAQKYPRNIAETLAEKIMFDGK